MNEDDILNAAIYGEIMGYMRKVDGNGDLLYNYEFMEWQGDTYLISYDVTGNVLDGSRKLDGADFVRNFLSKNEFQMYSTVKRRNRWTEQGIAKRNAEIERLRRI